MRKAELATYKPDTDSQRDALRLAKKFVESFPVEQKGLVFFGPPGVGKTHLAIGLLKAVIRDKGARGYFFQTTELLRLVRETYNRWVEETEMDVLRPVLEADVLVLDDLGVEKTSEWVQETLGLVINTRYNARRATIVTSNLRRSDRQHRHELVHGAARRPHAVAPARNVRVGGSAGRRHSRCRAHHQRRQDRPDAGDARSA